MNDTRRIERLLNAVETSDGAGVRIRRSLGQSPGARLDPFLMLDEFGSDDAADYIAGFPAHPHRGFETVTYMLDGHMLHEDHLGNRGHLASGGVQWMSAARGIIHSEMPGQEAGRMRGFQLWLNLPAAEKMKDPAYRDIPAEAIPRATFAGGSAKVIAGAFAGEGGRVEGAVGGLTTEPLYLDVRLEPGARLVHPLDAALNALVYAFEGEVSVGEPAIPLPAGSAGILGAGDSVTLRAGPAGAAMLILAGRPIGEPVVQYGPFVMNTREEIEQALRDYRDGTLAGVARAG